MINIIKKHKVLSKLVKNSVLLNKTGDLSYTETAITTIIILLVLAMTLNIFSFFTLKQDLEYCCEQLIEEAACDGRTGSAVSERYNQLCSELSLDPENLHCSFDGTDFYGSGDDKVQYGNVIVLTLTYNTTFGGTGIFKIPVSVSCSASGLSEKYWKS